MPPWLIQATVAGVIQIDYEYTKQQSTDYAFFKIKTLEGDHRAEPGDWIIQGVKGELYPCKPDIFELTYEAIPEPANAVEALNK